VARFPRQRRARILRQISQQDKSVRYGFGTATFIVPVLAVQQHDFKEKGAFNGPYRSYGRRTAATRILGTIFQQIVQHLMQGQSVRYGCLCTDFEGGCVGFLPVNFKHGNRGKR
jgi:hypothetical protein